MILILEIVLTVLAWRKGWKWKALLPPGIGFMTAFLMGIAIEVSGGNVNSAVGVGLVIDLGVIISLIIMLASEPKRAIAPSVKVEKEKESVKVLGEKVAEGFASASRDSV